MYNVSDIRLKFINKFQNKEFIEDKSGSKLIELLGYSFNVTEDYIIRKPNYDYIQRELEWYKSESLYVKDIPGVTPKIWNEVSSTEGKINSNYGYLIFSEQNYNQFNNAINELLKNKNSRRATMIYQRPSMHYEYNSEGMSDFVCTYANQFFIRDNKLISHYMMRSNDVVFGYNNDVAWAKYVHDLVLNKLKEYYPELELGNLIWTASSLHCYENHFKYIQKYLN
jgi:thymidylate synthase